LAEREGEAAGGVSVATAPAGTVSNAVAGFSSDAESVFDAEIAVAGAEERAGSAGSPEVRVEGGRAVGVAGGAGNAGVEEAISMIPAANSSALTVSRGRDGVVAAGGCSVGTVVEEGVSLRVRFRVRFRTGFAVSE